MLILKKLEKPIDLGFTVLTMKYIEQQKGEKKHGNKLIS